MNSKLRSQNNQIKLIKSFFEADEQLKKNISNVLRNDILQTICALQYRIQLQSKSKTNDNKAENENLVLLEEISQKLKILDKSIYPYLLSKQSLSRTLESQVDQFTRINKGKFSFADNCTTVLTFSEFDQVNITHIHKDILELLLFKSPNAAITCSLSNTNKYFVLDFISKNNKPSKKNSAECKLLLNQIKGRLILSNGIVLGGSNWVDKVRIKFPVQLNI
jgi:glucose-6-phosphate-specific signal transduction histidine kinase